jgi:hypothetical protein
VRDVDRIEGTVKRSPRALTSRGWFSCGSSWLPMRGRSGPTCRTSSCLCSLPVRGLGKPWRCSGLRVDLGAARVDITHTIVRVKGEGLVRKVTKSRAGERALPLPKFAVSMLRARCAAGIRLGEPVFADSNRGFRDPSNVRRDLREARSPSGNAARRDLGLSLRAVRRGAGMSRKDVATSLGWPQNRVALVEAGRVKVDRLLATEMLRVYDVEPSPARPLETIDDPGHRHGAEGPEPGRRGGLGPGVRGSRSRLTPGRWATGYLERGRTHICRAGVALESENHV